jgi:hypothetical protein
LNENKDNDGVVGNDGSAAKPPPVVTTQEQQQQQQPPPVSSNAFASGASMNGPQVMTGRPTSRVLHPGGGGGPTQWKLG